MYLILDTDLITILQRRSQPAYDRLQARLQARSTDDVCVTVVSFQEQARGWLAELNRARKAEKILLAYQGVLDLLHYFCAAKVLPFDQAAQDHFAELTRQRLRIGTLDLRIASIVLAVGGTLLSRNLRHFRQVPGLVVEDWTC